MASAASRNLPAFCVMYGHPRRGVPEGTRRTGEPGFCRASGTAFKPQGEPIDNEAPPEMDDAQQRALDLLSSNSKSAAAEADGRRRVV